MIKKYAHYLGIYNSHVCVNIIKYLVNPQEINKYLIKVYILSYLFEI